MGGMALALALALSGCGEDQTHQPAPTEPSQGADEKVNVYTTVYPLSYVASRIGGEHAEVVNIVPTGVEPHDFEPTAKDVVAMSGADVFIYNGSGLEAWVDQVVDGLDRTNVIVVNATEGLPVVEAVDGHETGHDGDHHEEESASGEHETESHGHDHSHGPVDPHVWLDPTLLKQQAEKVKEALVKADAAHQADFEKNYRQLAADLDALDQEFQAMAREVPRKEFVVSHAAFGYLANRYGLKQVAISGLSPADEPSPAELRKLVEYVKERGIRHILFESLVSPDVAETIARETGARTAVLNPLEGLTEAEAKAGKDYLAIMRENLETLRKALSE